MRVVTEDVYKGGPREDQVLLKVAQEEESKYPIFLPIGHLSMEMATELFKALSVALQKEVHCAGCGSLVFEQEKDCPGLEP